MILTFFDIETQHTYQELGIYNKYDKKPDKLRMSIGGILHYNTE